MASIKKFEDIKCWQNARILNKQLFILTNRPDFNNEYRFRSQLRASAGSVMDNIAEGYERGGDKEFIQFLYISKGSLGEVKSQVYRAFDFKYFSVTEKNELMAKIESISAQIKALIEYLKESNFSGIKYKSNKPKNPPDGQTRDPETMRPRDDETPRR